MGRIFAVELDGRFYGCKSCKTHLALANDLISRGFYCQRGKAYLFNNVVNFTCGEVEERLMLSGLHTVKDIFCCRCGQIIGWKYESAHEKSQKYKEGKFVLERGRIVDEIDYSTEFCVDSCVSMSDDAEDD
ncbi:protein yippee-like At5g53940 isoform X1 [Cicer arietinum]|uniref:Protein yippee-like n=1 Tax=Cicer arietinum TaxID=3827 RepID=A0A1S2YU88_CICAR|nr:protein yippee-like At5g53940 isoform X1 [Cicer arietinum]